MEFLVIFNTLVLILAGSLITYTLSARIRRAKYKAVRIRNEAQSRRPYNYR